MAESSQVEAADAAWAAAKRRFLVPETELLADFLGADARRRARPAAER